MAAPAYNELTLCELARGIAQKKLTSHAVVESCLERIAARDPAVKAWAHLDADAALATARRADESIPLSALHGIPIGLKDIIDTADMPTCYGSRAFANHHLEQDAACVARLRNAGAVILGKTVTTEFACYAPGATTNPHDPAHTPGGSSSGSAAAVADFHVPLAFGTQTSGSIIRPASFTGVVGYKPSFDAYPVDGIHPVAPSLDTLGVFTRGIEDLALCNDVLATSPALHCDEPKAQRPRKVAVVRAPYWRLATPNMRESFDNLIARIEEDGVACTPFEPNEIDSIVAAQTELMAHESVATLGPIAAQFGDLVNIETHTLVAQGRALDGEFATRLVAARDAARAMMDELFADHDVVIAPGAPGEAPAGLESTGDPIFNRVWTFCRAPCIGVPIGTGDGGLPLGVQFVGRPGADADLVPFALHLNRYHDYVITPP